MESPQCCCNNFYSMRFNYINGKPFILCIKYFKEAMQNLQWILCMNTNSSEATGLDFKASWYQGEDRAWTSDTDIVGEVPDDSQQEPQTQYSSGISSALSPAQGWHRGRITQVNWKDPEPAGLDRPCRQGLNKSWCQWRSSIKALISRQH